MADSILPIQGAWGAGSAPGWGTKFPYATVQPPPPQKNRIRAWSQHWLAARLSLASLTWTPRGGKWSTAGWEGRRARAGRRCWDLRKEMSVSGGVTISITATTAPESREHCLLYWLLLSLSGILLCQIQLYAPPPLPGLCHLDQKESTRDRGGGRKGKWVDEEDEGRSTRWRREPESPWLPNRVHVLQGTRCLSSLFSCGRSAANIWIAVFWLGFPTPPYPTTISVSPLSS